MSAQAPQQSTSPQARGAPVVDRVLDVVIAHLAARGYAGLSVPDVAVEAGVHKTSVYRRFPTKAVLVQAALARALGHDVTPPDTGTVRGDMLEVARAAVGFVGSPVGTGVMRTLLGEGGDPEVRALALTALASQQADAPQIVVARGIARGELPADVDASMLFRTIAGAVLHGLFVEQAPIDEAFLVRLVDLALYGVAARRPGPP